MRSWCLQVTFSVTSPSHGGRLPTQPPPGPGKLSEAKSVPFLSVYRRRRQTASGGRRQRFAGWVPCSLLSKEQARLEASGPEGNLLQHQLPPVGARPWPVGIKLPEEGARGYAQLCHHVSFDKEINAAQSSLETPGSRSLGPDMRKVAVRWMGAPTLRERRRSLSAGPLLAEKQRFLQIRLSGPLCEQRV